jgi:hypothetical protein
MITCKGIVKDNTVILEEGARLPEGAEVEVRLAPPTESRKEAFARVLSYPITRPVGIDEIIEEDKREREERPDEWLR